MNIVKGVGLLLFDPQGKIFILRELQSKPHYNKVAGMLSPPLETVEQGETNPLALKRLVYEEIGVSIQYSPKFFKEILIKLSKKYSVKLYMYTGNVKKQFIGKPNDTDIEYYGWMKPNEILNLKPNEKRIEVDTIIQLYLNS